MAQNTGLFPTVYSNICPGTQTTEVDRFAALQNQILLVRYQLQIGFRKDGQSIAELQNSTLQVSNALQPIPTLGKTLIGGGSNFQVHGQVRRFSHSVEVLSDIADRFAVGRIRHAGFASSQNAYWAGGGSSYAIAAINSIESLNFDSEQYSSVSATLASTLFYCRGAQSETNGYVGGNYAGGLTGPINRMVFATQAVTALAATLLGVTGAPQAHSAPTKAYYSGGHGASATWGSGGTKQITALTFSGETTAVLGATLVAYRAAASQFSSHRRGFSHNGADIRNNVALQTIEYLSFETETTSLVSNQLASKPAADGDGISAARKGYATSAVVSGAPNNPNNTILETQYIFDGYEFASDTNYAFSVALHRGGRYAISAGKP